jgi:hypothetical protein
VNAFAVANALASTLALFKSIEFCYAFVIDWEPKNGVTILVWLGIFAFSLEACCTQ